MCATECRSTPGCGRTSTRGVGRAASTSPSSSILKYSVLAALGGGVIWPVALFISLSSPLALAIIGLRGAEASSRRSRRCAPWCAAGPIPASEAQREPRAAPPRCLRQTTRRTPLPQLLWTSVSVELCSQPPRPCPSSVPVGRSTFHQPPPCRSCGGRLRTGTLRRSAAHVATTSAGVAAFSGKRSRDRHAATCRPPEF